MATNYITDDVRKIIGAQSDWVDVSHVVEPSEVRRFFQAVIDPNPRYWDSSRITSERYDTPVAPPGFPVHAVRRAPGDLQDPLDLSDKDPDFDGQSRWFRPGLPRVPVPLGATLNGGYEYEFYSYAKVGERIKWRSRYRDVYQRDGKNGALIFVVMEDEYATSDGRPLLKAINTQIMR